LGLAEKVKKTGAKYFVVEQPGALNSLNDLDVL